MSSLVFCGSMAKQSTPTVAMAWTVCPVEIGCVKEEAVLCGSLSNALT
uniref:Uncharacterized protein n=1 Tax=Anguilla anguilla TaxID=7936 RepID=A0A0E9QCW0_ANGAN